MEENIVIGSTIDAINSIDSSNRKVHIRIRQRNNKKCVTTIEQLPDTVLVSIIKAMRQTFGCNGSIQNSESGKFIQLFGDQRAQAKKYLIDNFIAREENIVVHGY